MKREDLKIILENVKSGEKSIDEALNDLSVMPYKELGYAKIDYHRGLRQNYPEVVFCQGKRIEHLKGIVSDMIKRDANILLTRANEEVYKAVLEVTDKAVFHRDANIIIVNPREVEMVGKIAVVTGGTADIPVAEEASIICELFGNKVERYYDVGVAGIHRLFDKIESIREANVIIAIAGMEGALASVVAGLVDCPVIAVPTSVGYGANFKGLAALLTMLNSCAAGIGVVNIDNGFGAAYMASMINRKIEKK